MSALPTGDDVVFRMRMARDELKADLRAAESDVQAAATRQRAAIDKVFGPPIKPRFSIEEQELRNQMAAAFKVLKEQAKQTTIAVKVRAELENSAFDPAKEARAKFAGTAGMGGAASAAAAGGISGLVAQGQAAARAFGTVAKAVTAVGLAIKGAEITLSGVELIAAAISGEYERSVKAAENATTVLKGIPIVGDFILSFGATINKYTIDLVTHEQEYIDKIKKATEAQEKHSAEMAKKAGKQKDAIAAAEEALKGVGSTEDPDVSEEQKRLQKRIESEKKLQEALNAPGMKDKFGKATETAKDIQARANRQIANEEIARDDARTARQDKQLVEFEANRLRSIGDIAGAERIELEQTLKEKEQAAAKINQDTFEFQKTLNQQDRDAFEKLQEEKSRIAEEADVEEAHRANDEMQDRIQQAEDEQKKIDDIKREHQQQTDDLQFNMHQKMLRRTGQAELAEREAIERAAKKAIEEGADAAAVIANAKEDLLGLEDARKSGPSFDIVQRADLLNFGGGGVGKFNPKTELSKDGEAIIKKLGEIKGPQVAVTAP